jgi:cobalamin biosynthesis Mg chelatase CobN
MVNSCPAWRALVGVDWSACAGQETTVGPPPHSNVVHTARPAHVRLTEASRRPQTVALQHSPGRTALNRGTAAQYVRSSGVGADARQCEPQTRARNDERRTEVNNMLWTIFAIIGIIVVIGWAIGRF